MISLQRIAPTPVKRVTLAPISRRSVVRVNASADGKENGAPVAGLDKDLSRVVQQTANTFAPRASGKTGKNPAIKGTVLYDVFVWQAWLSAAVGGLLSFNVLFPSDEPDVWRLMGMWSVWMFTIPSLRAKECDAAEKNVLNILFLGVPLLNIALPFIWKSFAFVWTADMVMTLGIYWFKYWSPEAQEQNAAAAAKAAAEEAAAAAAEEAASPAQ